MSAVLEIVMRFVARNPPSILFLGAILFALLGNMNFAYDLLVVGVVLQVLWLLLFRRKG
jgi:hypothetical protein